MRDGGPRRCRKILRVSASRAVVGVRAVRHGPRKPVRAGWRRYFQLDGNAEAAAWPQRVRAPPRERRPECPPNSRSSGPLGSLALPRYSSLISALTASVIARRPSAERSLFEPSSPHPNDKSGPGGVGAPRGPAQEVSAPMHHHRNAGAELAPRRATTPPPAGSVHGLGVVDALRIDLEPGQLPWLAAEIDTLRYCLEDELAHQRPAMTSCPRPRRRVSLARQRARPSRSSSAAPTSSRPWR